MQLAPLLWGTVTHSLCCCSGSVLFWLQVAERVGLPMLGVNIPGHFFITPKAEGTEFLVDAFAGGLTHYLHNQ